MKISKEVLVKLEGFIKDLTDGEYELVKVVSKDTPAPAVKEEKQVEEVKEEAKDVTSEGYTLDDLNGMSVKELREIAKGLGLAVRGSKSAIIGRILEATESQEPKDEPVEPVHEDEPVAEEEVEEDTPVEDEALDAEETEEGENDLQEALEGLELEDLADLCEQAGLKAKGKKSALIGKLIVAHNEGDIDLFDMLEFEEESDEEVEEEDDAIDVADILEEQDTKTLKAICKKLGVKVTMKDKKPSLIAKLVDEEGIIDALIEAGVIESEEGEETEEVEFEAVGSEARIEAVTNAYNEIMEDYANEELDIEEVREFLVDAYDGNKSEIKRVKALDEEEVITEYAEMVANLFDDEGEEVELSEAFLVGDDPYCCGRPMKHVKGDTYTCTVCGEDCDLSDDEDEE